jgi:hypothetical protein
MNQRGKPSHGWRVVVRRGLSTVMLLAGSMAVIATSPPFSELHEEHEGLAFDVVPGAEVKLPFELDVSDAARNGDGWGAHFVFSVVWRGADSAERTLEITVVNAQGETVATEAGSDNLRLSCRDLCIGGGEVVIRWPSRVDHGEATVDWNAGAEATFNSDEVPEGATLRFTISDPPIESRLRELATGVLSNGRPFERRVVSRQRITINTDDPTGEYWLEIPELWTGYAPGAVFYVITAETRTRLDEAGSIPLLSPPGCGSPCVWSIDLVLVDESFRYDDAARVTWRLTQVGSSTATAESVDLPVASVEAHLAGGPVTLNGDERVSIPVRLDVEPETTTIADFEEHSPQVLLTLRATVDEEATNFPDRARLEQQIGGLVNPHNENIHGRSSPLYDDTFADRRPAITPAKLDCVQDVCSLEFEVGFETVGFGRGSVTLTWDLTAELFYPFATSVPAGAEMSLSQ